MLDKLNHSCDRLRARKDSGKCSAVLHRDKEEAGTGTGPVFDREGFVKKPIKTHPSDRSGFCRGFQGSSSI